VRLLPVEERNLAFDRGRVAISVARRRGLVDGSCLGASVRRRFKLGRRMASFSVGLEQQQQQGVARRLEVV
jgi:hypothetical protein